jgi:DNA repair photolyase
MFKRFSSLVSRVEDIMERTNPRIGEDLVLGCVSNCRYCFSKTNKIRKGLKTSENWKDEVLIGRTIGDSYPRQTKQVMYPASHNLSPTFLNPSLTFIEQILKGGNSLFVVCKPYFPVIQRIVTEFKTFLPKITFSFTITSVDESTLRFWEPGAPDFEERLESLKYARSAGFRANVFCQPILDEDPASLFEKVSRIASQIRVGKFHFPIWRLQMNGETNPEAFGRARDLERAQDDRWVNDLLTRYPRNQKQIFLERNFGVPMPSDEAKFYKEFGPGGMTEPGYP